MLVIPSIDLCGGKCVRLIRGNFDRETVYSDDPLEVALRWEDKGAEMIHIVDLDGAKSGVMENLPVIRAIVDRLMIPVELGGGLRTYDRVKEMFNIGISKVVVGTAAVKYPDMISRLINEFGHRVLVGVDSRDGRVATQGWIERSSKSVEDVVTDMKERGVTEFIYTDISRDGTLIGPDLEGISTIIGLGVKVIASGGVSSLEDIRRLHKLSVVNMGDGELTGVIIGKALYSGDISLEDALGVV